MAANASTSALKLHPPTLSNSFKNPTVSKRRAVAILRHTKDRTQPDVRDKGGKLVRITAMVATWLLALLGAVNAHAIPMNFSVSYDGSKLGGAGSGSFTFDDEANQLTNFTFRFGEVTGALPNQNLSFPIFGGSAASFIFEILSGQDAHPEECGTTIDCGVNLEAIGVRFVMFNRLVGAPLASYEFRDAVTRMALFAGNLSVQQVPEPASLALIGLGVLGVALARRKRWLPSQ
jgi:hypothetical protein